MNIDELTFGQLKQIQSLMGGATNEPHPYEVGKNYIVKTVTHYYLGRLSFVGSKELVLEGASWVADTGRYNEFVKGSLENSNIEIEPILQPTIIGRGAIVEVTLWNAALPKEVK